MSCHIFVEYHVCLKVKVRKRYRKRCPNPNVIGYKTPPLRVMHAFTALIREFLLDNNIILNSWRQNLHFLFLIASIVIWKNRGAVLLEGLFYWRQYGKPGQWAFHSILFIFLLLINNGYFTRTLSIIDGYLKMGQGILLLSIIIHVICLTSIYKEKEVYFSLLYFSLGIWGER